LYTHFDANAPRHVAGFLAAGNFQAREAPWEWLAFRVQAGNHALALKKLGVKPGKG